LHLTTDSSATWSGFRRFVDRRCRQRRESRRGQRLGTTTTGTVIGSGGQLNLGAVNAINGATVTLNNGEHSISPSMAAATYNYGGTIQAGNNTTGKIGVAA